MSIHYDQNYSKKGNLTYLTRNSKLYSNRQMHGRNKQQQARKSRLHSGI